MQEEFFVFGMVIMEKKMEATIVYRAYIGIMENKMEATIVYRGYWIDLLTLWGLWMQERVLELNR